MMTTDYFGEYFNEQGFDFSRLLNDDFFQPIRILFNEKHYVSATKLLLIAIDSVGFIEYGDTGDNTFTKWLNTYADLEKLSITAEELWEQRNSLLHMSNLDSRKVLEGSVRRLITYVGSFNSGIELNNKNEGYYNLYSLISVFGEACGKWISTYDTDRKKIYAFIDRYDLIASDARMLHVTF